MTYSSFFGAIRIFIAAAILYLAAAADITGQQRGGGFGVRKIDSLQGLLKFEEAKLEEAVSSGSKPGIFDANFKIAGIWKEMKIYDKAGDYYMEALRYAEDLEDNKKTACTFLALGELYRIIAELAPSIQYLKKALELYELEKYKPGIGKAYERLAGAMYETVPLYPLRADSAHTMIDKAIEIFTEIKNDSLLVSAYNIKGALYNTQKKFDKSIPLLEYALEYALKKNFLSDATLIRCNLGFSHWSSGEFETAIRYAREAFEYADRNNIVPYIDLASLCLYRSYYDLKDYKNAFKYLQVYNDSRFWLYDDERLSRIRALQIKYNSDKKELELKHERKTTIMWIALFSLLALSASATAAFFIFRNKVIARKNSELEKSHDLISNQNEKLTELNATKDKFFSIIGHDLKNPYQSLMGFSNILIQDYKELTEQEIKEFVGYIYEASEMGNRLLQNLLDWSRSETGRIRYEPEYFYLSEIVEEALRLASNTAMQKEISIQAVIPEKLEVYCDRNMIYTVLRNLISNAIKFSFRSGTIKIEAAVESSTAEISITDKGVGMTEALMADLFKLDKRITNDGTEDEKGTGLGLYLCKEFIERNKGTISVKSALRKGSTFTFTLPARTNTADTGSSN